MNLSPVWGAYLRENGFEAVQWSNVGEYTATDSDIMRWARDGDWVVFTHDLDFGIILAHTKEGKPSVIQVRTQEGLPESIGSLVLHVLRAHGSVLESGALVTLDAAKSRVRILPI